MPESPPPASRRIAELAVPALVVLAAEPSYVLVDTAVVGHLGGVELAALALAGSLLSVAVWLGTVLAYGTTARSARRFGAGDRSGAVAEGVAASWLALVVGASFAALAQLFAEPLTRAFAGGEAQVAQAAAAWLRIASLGAPGILLILAGNGWMRGVQQTRRPMQYAIAANGLSALLCPVLVYPVGLGLAGSAVANVVAQTAGAAMFVTALRREGVTMRPDRTLIRHQLVVNRELLVRGGAFQVCFLSAAAVTARFGAPALGAHQIALQLWMFCALALDAIAIAAQALVGASLGAGDGARARHIAMSVARVGGVFGLLFAALIGAGAGVIPALFTTDPAVRAQALIAWPWFVAMQPLAGVVFALDGVLIGAGDLRYLRNLTVVCALGVFLPAIWLALLVDAGIGGVWAGLTLFIVARLVGLVLRVRGPRWAVVGAAH